MKTALVLDDQEFTTEFFSKLLTKEFDFEVITTENGVEGLKAYTESKPDIIFLDISMPILDGHGFLKELRQKMGDTETPVIMITANRDKALVGEFIKLGIVDYILKPFHYKELTERLKKIFEPVFAEQPEG